jgi:hypothetical protein
MLDGGLEEPQSDAFATPELTGLRWEQRRVLRTIPKNYVQGLQWNMTVSVPGGSEPYRGILAEYAIRTLAEEFSQRLFDGAVDRLHRHTLAEVQAAVLNRIDHRDDASLKSSLDAARKDRTRPSSTKRRSSAIRVQSTRTSDRRFTRSRGQAVDSVDNGVS